MLIKSCLLYVFMKGHIKVKSYHSATPKLNIPSQNCSTQKAQPTQTTVSVKSESEINISIFYNQ